MTSRRYSIHDLPVQEASNMPFWVVPDARAALQKVIDAPLNVDWIPEDGEFKEKAQRALETTKEER